MGTESVRDLLREALQRPAVIHRPGCAEGDLLDRLMQDDSFMECSCGGTSQFHAAVIEDEAASPVPAPTQTGFAWLIERGQPERQVPTVWWKDRKRWGLTHMDDWTEDANEAARFATRDEAEAFIGSKFTPPVGEPSARAVEHGFLSPVPAPTLDAAYRERNALVAGLIRVGGFRAEIVMAPDTEGWWIVYVETPAGQLSWHISPDDMDLFSDWPVAFGTRPSPWDGHTTEEKYRRLAALASPDTETP